MRSSKVLLLPTSRRIRLSRWSITSCLYEGVCKFNGAVDHDIVGARKLHDSTQRAEPLGEPRERAVFARRQGEVVDGIYVTGFDCTPGDQFVEDLEVEFVSEVGDRDGRHFCIDSVGAGQVHVVAGAFPHYLEREEESLSGV